MSVHTNELQENGFSGSAVEAVKAWMEERQTQRQVKEGYRLGKVVSRVVAAHAQAQLVPRLTSLHIKLSVQTRHNQETKRHWKPSP
eukprot:3387974-Amphidinium_carterae.1